MVVKVLDSEFYIPAKEYSEYETLFEHCKNIVEYLEVINADAVDSGCKPISISNVDSVIWDEDGLVVKYKDGSLHYIMDCNEGEPAMIYDESWFTKYGHDERDEWNKQFETSRVMERVVI